MRILNPPVFLLDPSEEFRPDTVIRETGWEFRKYRSDIDDPALNSVYQTYFDMHSNQTVDFVNEKMAHWTKFDKFKLPMLEALDLLNSFVDSSDPDIALPNAVHAYQTAERIRATYPNEEWFHFAGLVHDLGKVMALYDEPQWAVVGDTFPVGCAVAPSVVLQESTFSNNPDTKDTRYNTKLGMYEEGCGLDNVTMSWGHDEYMYRVLKHNNCTIPQHGLDIIRYHSFYPWHTGGDYQHLCNQKDRDTLQWILAFNKFDLYTKKDKIPDMAVLRPYYQTLVDKFCPGDISF
uniref:Inositol oxygenase n=2 Tax=Hirondellea gigas TaxID=1518452 RepID=A0A2P2HXK0_9CRUS